MDDTRFFRIAKALSDPRRFEIFERIAAAKEESCAAINGCMGVSAATISHHVKELADAGLIDIRKDGKFAYLSARRAALNEYLRALRQKVRAR